MSASQMTKDMFRLSLSNIVFTSFITYHQTIDMIGATGAIGGARVDCPSSALQ
jgi:hypothetical protein